MTGGYSDRRNFLKRLAVALGGLAVVPALSQPALAGRSRWRGGWGWGGGGWRVRSGRRFYGGYGYGPGSGGYGYGPGFYNRGFGGYYAPRYYAPAPAYPVTPYVAPSGGYYYPPILKRETARDALGLLEC